MEIKCYLTEKKYYSENIFNSVSYKKSVRQLLLLFSLNLDSTKLIKKT